MFKKIQLKNGLSVLFIESQKSPVVSVQMWVRTGSADEPDELRGMSHFIEHLVFKGSAKYGVGQIASTVEGSGGELNAYTSFDQTVFYVTISKEFAETGLDVISQMMGSPSFDPAEIDNEREVVIEEIKRSIDSPHRQASRLLFETLYQRHPYGQPVIGFEEIIRKVTPEQIRSYYDSRYVPSNMTLLVVGDFHTAEMKKLVERYFAGFKARRKKVLSRARESMGKRPRVEIAPSTFNENFLFVSWPTPAATHRDIAALDALALILGQGDSSRLSRGLRLERHLANYAGASTFTPKDPGFFAISMSLAPGQLPQAVEQMTVELERILNEPPSQDEMGKTLINFQSDQFYNLETVDGMARKYGHFEDLFKDYRHFKKFVDQVNRLKPLDLVRVARKYLRPETLRISMLVGQSEMKEAQLLRQWPAQYAKVFKKKKTATKPSKHKKIRLPREWFPSPGPRLLRRADVPEKVVFSDGTIVILKPNFDSPVVSLRAAFLGGARRDPENQQGLTELISRTWVSATQKRSEVELMGAIESLASSLSAFGGRNTAGLNMTALSPFADEVFDLLSEVLLTPRFLESVVEREKAQMLEQLRTRADNPAQVAILKFMESLFKAHPYGRDPLGNEGAVRGIKSGDIESSLSKFCSSRNLIVSMSGYLDPDKWLVRLEALSQQLPRGQRELKTVPYTPPDKEVRVFHPSQKEQSHIVIGYPGLRLTDPDRYTLQVLEAILAGQGGRLFVELRDKASLAYSVAPLRMEGIETGYFGAYIGCSPEKGTKAVEMLLKEFHRLAEKGVQPEELGRAQRYLVGRHDIDLQRSSAVSAAMLFDEIYGIDFTESFKYAERIRSVTGAEVLQLAKKIFSQSAVYSAVGPRSPW